MSHGRALVTSLVVTLWLTAMPAVVQGQATWWPAEAGGTGHFYEPVLAPDGISCADAAADAFARGGYLATPTTSAENTFCYDLISDPAYWFVSSNASLGPWLGGLQTAGSSEPAGGWQWPSGERWSYEAWAPGEPNNLNGIESRLQFIALGTATSALWNDAYEHDDRMLGYVVEYDQAPPFINWGGAVSGAGPLPVLTATGAMALGASLELTVTNAPLGGVAHLVLGLSPLNVPLWNGILVPAPDVLLLNLPVDPTGTVSQVAPWPPGVPGGIDLWFQYWMPDPTASKGWAASDGVQGTSL